MRALIAALLGITVCAAAAVAREAESNELAALLGYFKTRGVELRAAPDKSNVISPMYSIGPQHEKQLLVGLTWHAQEPTTAAILAKSPVAIPFVINGHWALWRVGGRGGNATAKYEEAWNRTLGAFQAYVAPR
jgi:hypothetical protein